MSISRRGFGEDATPQIETEQNGATERLRRLEMVMPTAPPPERPAAFLRNISARSAF
jgi:hypothetical protein